MKGCWSWLCPTWFHLEEQQHQQAVKNQPCSCLEFHLLVVEWNWKSVPVFNSRAFPHLPPTQEPWDLQHPTAVSGDPYVDRSPAVWLTAGFSHGRLCPYPKSPPAPLPLASNGTQWPEGSDESRQDVSAHRLKPHHHLLSQTPSPYTKPLPPVLTTTPFSTSPFPPTPPRLQKTMRSIARTPVDVWESSLCRVVEREQQVERWTAGRTSRAALSFRPALFKSL